MEAKAKKPSKPFFLLNWITFGMANKNYYRDFAEWNAVCFPLVREYESYQVDLKLDKEELESHREERGTQHLQTWLYSMVECPF